MALGQAQLVLCAWVGVPNIQLSMGGGKIPRFSLGRSTVQPDLGNSPCRSSPATGPWCLPGMKSGAGAGGENCGEPGRAQPGLGSPVKPWSQQAGSVSMVLVTLIALSHPAEHLLMPMKKTPSPAWNHWTNLQVAEEGAVAFSHCLEGQALLLCPLLGLKQHFPEASWLPKKPGHTRDVADWLLTWKDIKWKDLASGGGLSKGLTCAEPKKLSKYQCCLFCCSSEGGTGVKEHLTAKCSLNHNYFSEFPFPASLRKFDHL